MKNEHKPKNAIAVNWFDSQHVLLDKCRRRDAKDYINARPCNIKLFTWASASIKDRYG